LTGLHAAAVAVALTISLLHASAGTTEAGTQKIRVAVEDATIRSAPDMTSRVIDTPAFGSVFDVREKVGEWYRVDYLSRVGVVVTGYVHEMFVEEEREIHELAPSGKRRAFGLSVSGGVTFPTGAMAGDAGDLSLVERGDTKILFRSSGPEFAVAGEYSFSPVFGVGLRCKIATFSPGTYPSGAVMPDRNNEIVLMMVDAYGKAAFFSQKNTRPYILVGAGVAIADPAGFCHYDETGTWYVVDEIDDKPYVCLGGGLDHRVSSRVSLFGEVNANVLFWRGARFSSRSLQGTTLDMEYLFLDVAAGVRIGFGGK
jgi:hypothetical protein